VTEPTYLVSGCATVDEFVSAFRRYVDRRDLFVPTATPTGVGKSGMFAVTLSTGEILISGKADVISSSSRPAGLHGRAGMTLRFADLDADSQAVLDHLEKVRFAAKVAVAAGHLKTRPGPDVPERTAASAPPKHLADPKHALAECIILGADAAPAPEKPLSPRFAIPSIPSLAGGVATPSLQAPKTATPPVGVAVAPPSSIAPRPVPPPLAPPLAPPPTAMPGDDALAAATDDEQTLASTEAPVSPAGDVPPGDETPTTEGLAFAATVVASIPVAVPTFSSGASPVAPAAPPGLPARPTPRPGVSKATIIGVPAMPAAPRMGPLRAGQLLGPSSPEPAPSAPAAETGIPSHDTAASPSISGPAPAGPPLALATTDPAPLEPRPVPRRPTLPETEDLAISSRSVASRRWVYAIAILLGVTVAVVVSMTIRSQRAGRSEAPPMGSALNSEATSVRTVDAAGPGEVDAGVEVHADATFAPVADATLSVDSAVILDAAAMTILVDAGPRRPVNAALDAGSWDAGAPPIDAATEVRAPTSDGEGPCLLQVASVPEGSEVVIAGSVRGVTPAKIKLPCGQTTFTLRRPRYQSITKTLRVEKKTSFTGKLERPVFPLKISSSPTGATVTIDGKKVGKTPITASVAGHRALVISISKTGFETASQTITVRQSGSTVRLDLAKK
jgi:hypothetical protein